MHFDLQTAPDKGEYVDSNWVSGTLKHFVQGLPLVRMLVEGFVVDEMKIPLEIVQNPASPPNRLQWLL